MKLKFIGTGNMENKSCNTSIMIDNILFDIGNGVVHQLDNLNIDLKDIKYLVISHFHGDHFLDITNLLISRKLRGISNILKIIGPIGLRKKIIDLFVFAFGDGKKDYSDIEDKYKVEFIELNDQEEYIIDNKVLKAYKLVHGDNKEVLGYTYDNKVAYFTDTTLCDNFYQLCNNIKYILADVTMMETTAAHIGLNDFIKIAINYPKTKFYAIHRNDYDTDNIKEVIFPNDGEEIEIN